MRYLARNLPQFLAFVVVAILLVAVARIVAGDRRPCDAQANPPYHADLYLIPQDTIEPPLAL